MGEKLHYSRLGRRRRIESTVALRDGTGAKIEVALFDISEFGCAICAQGVALEIGRIYSLKTAGVDPCGAKVVWVDDPYAGCKFIEPLHPAIPDILIRMFPPRNKTTILSDGGLLVEMVLHRARAKKSWAAPGKRI